MRIATRVFTAALIMSCFARGAALAQTSDAVVSGAGVIVVKKQPEVLRLTVQLSEKAKTVKEALAKLKDRRETAILKLETLGAADKSITLAPPTLSTAAATRQQQMMQMVMRQWRSQGRRIPKALQGNQSVTVVSELKAEWPMKVAAGDELLLASQELIDKVKAADLAGLKEPKKLTPEEEELAEEMQQAMQQFGGFGGGDGEAQPGEPKFLFVAKITEEERAAAMAEAFAKAKKSATRLANAAGMQIGKLAHLEGSTTNAEDYSSYAMQMWAAQQQVAADTTDDSEGASPLPGKVTFQIMVQAKFGLSGP